MQFGCMWCFAQSFRVGDHICDPFHALASVQQLVHSVRSLCDSSGEASIQTTQDLKSFGARHVLNLRERLLRRCSTISVVGGSTCVSILRLSHLSLFALVVLPRTGGPLFKV